MKITAIIPVWNARQHLAQGLRGLAAGARVPDELLVVDDGSTDGSGFLARSLGAQVITLADGPWGPARARNAGASQATGDLLVFLDADVVVHQDTLAAIEVHFTSEPGLAALFGSYDDAPPSPGLVSRFKNLLHHYTHQHSSPEASTFWAGCGALRREKFLALGGFDESYRCPAVEDIELGLRLKQAGGRIRLAPEVQVTHLKAWTFTGLISTDLFQRAVPWTRLILKQGHVPEELNLQVKHRLSALLAWAALALLVLGVWWEAAWLGVLLVLGVQVILNRDLYRLFGRNLGRADQWGAMGLHNLYLLYSSLVFGILAACHWRRREAGDVKTVMADSSQGLPANHRQRRDRT